MEDAQPERIESIQWLRGIAASLVLFDHALMTIAQDGGAVAMAIPNLASFGASGVDLFFVISGFVMAQSLAALPRGGSAAFLKARWLRIVPLFVLMSGVYFIVLGEPVAWQSLLMTLTVLPVFDGNGYHVPMLWVGWTLGFEFAFYALVAVAAATPGAGRVPRLLALTVGAGCVGLVLHMPWAPLRLLANPLLFEFALGVGVWFILGLMNANSPVFASPSTALQALRINCGLAEAKQSRVSRAALGCFASLAKTGDTFGSVGHSITLQAPQAGRYAAAARITGAALLALGIAVGLGLPVNAHFDGAADGSAGLARTWTWGLPWALVLAGLVCERASGAVGSVLRVTGNASYATYLVHPAVLLLAGRYLDLTALPPVAVIPSLMLAATVAGIAVHRTVEQPLLRALKQRGPDRPSVGRAALQREHDHRFGR